MSKIFLGIVVVLSAYLIRREYIALREVKRKLRRYED